MTNDALNREDTRYLPSRIMMHISPKKAVNVYHADGTPVTKGEFVIPENVPFVYFSVLTSDGKAARTRAFRPEEYK